MSKTDLLLRGMTRDLVNAVVLYISYFCALIGVCWLDDLRLLLLGFVVLPVIGVPCFMGLIKLSQVYVNWVLRRSFDRKIEIRSSSIMLLYLVIMLLKTVVELSVKMRLGEGTIIALWLLFLSGIGLWGWEEQKKWEDEVWKSKRHCIEEASGFIRIKSLLLDVVLLAVPVMGGISFLFLQNSLEIQYGIKSKLWFFAGVFLFSFLIKDSFFLRSPGKICFSLYVGNKYDSKKCASMGVLVMRNLLFLVLLPIEIVLFFCGKERLADRFTETRVYSLSTIKNLQSKRADYR